MRLYTEKLKTLCDWAIDNPDTQEAQVIRQIVADLDGGGPIGGLLHVLNHDLFTKVVSMLIDFRRSAFLGPYREVHAQARDLLGLDITPSPGDTIQAE